MFLQVRAIVSRAVWVIQSCEHVLWLWTYSACGYQLASKMYIILHETCITHTHMHIYTHDTYIHSIHLFIKLLGITKCLIQLSYWTYLLPSHLQHIVKVFVRQLIKTNLLQELDGFEDGRAYEILCQKVRRKSGISFLWENCLKFCRFVTYRRMALSFILS